MSETTKVYVEDNDDGHFVVTVPPRRVESSEDGESTTGEPITVEITEK